MYEKVNPSHPDKIADRIAGAMLDLSYQKQANPKVAIEVLIGHKHCHIINETSCHLTKKEVKEIVYRIVEKKIKVDYQEVKQDEILANNQFYTFRCGDNGIFKGVPITHEQKLLSRVASNIYKEYPYDGKYIINDKEIIVCQSHATSGRLKVLLQGVFDKITVNPLGYWTGGTDVDSGATNRKLGSDMGEAVTGGGLCGKDFSKADVSVNIYCHLKAQEKKAVVTAYCAIGDAKVKVMYKDNTEYVNYADIVRVAKSYVTNLGGFEAFSEWGLIR